MSHQRTHSQEVAELGFEAELVPESLSITVSLKSDRPEFKFQLGPTHRVCPQAVMSPFEPHLPHLENGMKSPLAI